MTSFRNIASSFAIIVLCAAATHAALIGDIYTTNGNTLSAVTGAGGAVSYITGTPLATFTSTLVNSGTQYSGTDSSSLSTFLSNIPADQASAVGNPSPLGSFVMNLTGSLTVNVSGSYAFGTNNDDGGAFFLGGTGALGTGTAEGEVNGQHGQNGLFSTSVNLVAGTHYNVEYVYYNSSIGGGGGADAVGSIIGPGTVNISPQTVPEPSTFVLCGLGLVGLFIAARRRRKA